MGQEIGNFEVNVEVKGDKKTESRIDKMQKRIKKSFKEVEKGAKKGDSALKKHRKGLNKWAKEGGNRFEKMGKKTKEFFKAMPPQVAAGVAAFVALGAAAVAAGKAIFEFAKEQSELLDTIDKESQKIGLTAEKFQELEFASTRSGAEVGALGKSLKSLDLQLQNLETNEGDLKFVRALGEIGVAFDDIKKADPEGRLKLIADGIASIEDPTKRVQTATRLLGGQGKELVPLLAGGAQGISNLSEEAREYGIASDEAVAKGAEFQDSLANIEQVGKALKAEVFAELAPQIIAIVDEFRGWIQENDEFIKQDLAALLKELTILLIDIAKWSYDVIIAWKGFIKQLKDWNSFFQDKIKNNLEIMNNILEKIGVTADETGERTGALRGVFDRLAKVIDFLAKKTKEFVKQFDALNTLAIQLGIIEVETTTTRGGAKFLGGGADLVNPFTEEEQAAAEPPKKEKEKKKEARVQAQATKKTAAEKAARKKQLLRKARKKSITQVEQNELQLLGVPRAQIDKMLKAKGGGKKTSDVTLSQGLVALRTGGKNADKLISNFNSLAKQAPDTKGVEPTVAITNHIYDVDVNINNPKLQMDEDGLMKSVENVFDKIKKKSNAKTAADLSSARRA